MNPTEKLQMIPRLKIKPYDGMSVTAETWEQAHDEHRKSLQMHDAFFHGEGIIFGLEVTANDPPDHYVFISPGAAVDSDGNVIVLAETVAYDFSTSTEGELFLLLGHGEREKADDKNEVHYLESEYVVAARAALPKRPAVELARVNLIHSGNAINNAGSAGHPGEDEIDLRYRVKVGYDRRRLIKVGVAFFGKEPPVDVLNGWDYLALESSRSIRTDMVVDRIQQLSPGISGYDILYLAATGDFKVNNNQVKELAAFLKQGKGMIVEALDDAADGSLKPVFSALGVNLKLAAEYDAIFKSPFLFNAPPEGNQGSKVMVGQKIVYSTARYCLSWCGKVLGGSGTRADIRSAQEWGLNMVQYTL